MKKSRRKAPIDSFELFRPELKLEDAIRGLRNNETRVTSEVKGVAGKVSSETRVTYPAELVAAFRGLFGANRTYDFQLHQVLNVVSSAGGATLGFVAISPSVASYAEWTALAALFDECKGMSSHIDWNTAIPVGSVVQLPTVILAFDEQNLSSDPASTLAVYRLAESKTFVPQLSTGGSGQFRLDRKFTSRSWCNTSTPYSQSPVGGLIGCWVYGNSQLFTVTTTVAVISSITRARFRNRA
jgi:hypothetical protein